jgi:molybdate transport system substrate-binding protein
MKILRALVLPLVLLANPCLAENVTVFAAASLKESLDSAARQFEAATGHKVVVSYAASPVLTKQIESGGPADIFMSADLDWMDYLEARKQLVPGSRVAMLGNQLVLVAPAQDTALSTSGLKIAPNFALAAALGTGRLAMANPDAVPAGKYGKAALESLGVWNAVQSKVARAENVRSALAFVSRGEAPFGIVYRTDALADSGVRIVDTFPAYTHPPITYPAALIAGSKSSATAAVFLKFLRSPAATANWERFGFTVLK